MGKMINDPGFTFGRVHVSFCGIWHGLVTFSTRRVSFDAQSDMTEVKYLTFSFKTLK